jgi:hypothetical protein
LPGILETCFLYRDEIITCQVTVLSVALPLERC